MGREGAGPCVRFERVMGVPSSIWKLSLCLSFYVDALTAVTLHYVVHEIHVGYVQADVVMHYVLAGISVCLTSLVFLQPQAIVDIKRELKADIKLLGAYVLCQYFSANTIKYTGSDVG